ncbi:flagella basal body P-ring formation protein FlgA [Bifidobacterium sp. CP2]|uniref:SAF domain-containing protein n=1 Tax=Bifidobacterium sp. CP2 TaxID=2809025 RepID=UPI001BDD0E29|nr:SAF domain-containing protein [Bifidobacterium sp. CP2]MBT1181486.1 flagella basal body P-ring formation protein FlgA [Bifidobacterium sp. CP2]
MRRFTMPWTRLTRPTLAARRARVRAVRVAACCCLALACLMVLSVVESMTATVTVVVTARALARGETIGEGDVEMVEAPRSSPLDSALTSPEEAVGAIVQSDMAAGQPLFPGMARASPVPPAGSGVLEVAVSNDASALVPGDTVTLVSAVGCAEDEPQPCVLAEQALVMAQAKATREGAAGARLTVAMRPDEVLRVMASAELGAIVSVHE